LQADQGHLTHYRSPSEIAGARGGSRNRAYSCHWIWPKNVLNRSPGHDCGAPLVQYEFQRALVLRAGRDRDHHPRHSIVIWATMRSDVIGDFHEPYGEVLVCGIRYAIPVCVLFFRAVTMAASSAKRPDAMPNPVCVLQIFGKRSDRPRRLPRGRSRFRHARPRLPAKPTVCYRPRRSCKDMDARQKAGHERRDDEPHAKHSARRASSGCASRGRTARSSLPIPGRSRLKQSVGLMAEDRRDVGLLAITLADRLKPAGPRRSERVSAGLYMRAPISKSCSPTCRPIAAS
jgi:hypothetical protein